MRRRSRPSPRPCSHASPGSWPTSPPTTRTWSATTAPSLPNAELGGGEYMFVPKASPNQSCAWDFIRFLTEQEQQLDIGHDRRLDAGPRRPRSHGVPRREPWVRRLPSTSPTTWPIELLHADPGIRRDSSPSSRTHLVDAYADYENLSGNPTAIQALLDTLGNRDGSRSWPRTVIWPSSCAAVEGARGFGRGAPQPSRRACS